jgi:hypothetical protein
MSKFVLFLASLVFAASVYAAPASDASIDTLLTITKVERMLDGMFAGLDPMMRQMSTSMLKGQKLNPEQQRSLDNMMKKMSAVMRDEMSWAKMRPMYLQIYRETFTQEEVDGMIAFYRTPVGVATIDKMPAAMQKSMTLMQARMGPVMERMNAAMQQAIADAKAGK